MEWGLCICVRVYLGGGGVKVCVIGKLSVRESMREFLHNVFRARVRVRCVRVPSEHLRSMNVLVFAHTCYFACISYRSGKINCLSRHIQMYVCFFRLKISVYSFLLLLLLRHFVRFVIVLV